MKTKFDFMTIERISISSEKLNSHSPNNLPEAILEIGRKLISGELDPEESLRQVWRMSFAGKVTPSERQEGLKHVQDLFPSGVLAELNRLNPEGQTRLAQIAAEEVRAAKEAAKEREAMARRITPKRPSRGMRKHIRNEKAQGRRKGTLPPKL